MLARFAKEAPGIEEFNGSWYLIQLWGSFVMTIGNVVLKVLRIELDCTTGEVCISIIYTLHVWGKQEFNAKLFQRLQVRLAPGVVPAEGRCKTTPALKQYGFIHF